jgi:hypothetical protein
VRNSFETIQDGLVKLTLMGLTARSGYRHASHQGIG